MATFNEYIESAWLFLALSLQVIHRQGVKKRLKEERLKEVIGVWITELILYLTTTCAVCYGTQRSIERYSKVNINGTQRSIER